MNNPNFNTKIDALSLEILAFISTSPFLPFTIERIKESISKQRDTNYATIYRKIESLVNQGILQKSMYGMASQITLSLGSEKTLSVLSLIEAKKLEKFLNGLKGVLFTSINEIIKDIAPLSEIRCVVLFGSYAKGTQTKASDIDILVVYEPPSFLAPDLLALYTEEIPKSVRGILKRSELKGGPKIHPFIVTGADHADMILNKEINVAKEALSHHVLLKGLSEYWREIAGCGHAVKN